MKRFLLIILILSIALTGFNCQSKNNRLANTERLKTLKYAGTYRFGSYGDTTQTGPGGQVIIYALTDDSVLFYLDVSRGAPSYNMGSMYNRLFVNSNKCIFNIKLDYCDNPCKLEFEFNDSTLTISTIDNDCGFGGNVIADGIYKKVDSNQPKYFENGEGDKVYFDKMTPENYNK